MHNTFTFITNDLHFLGEMIHQSKQVRKIFKFLSKSWESKVDANIKATLKLTIWMIGNLKTHDFNKK